MRVLVTGGAGYLGSVLSQLLLAFGLRVRVLDSLLYGGDSLLSLYGHRDFEFRRGDVRSPEVVTEVLRDIDAIVHLAAIVGDPACAKDTKVAREVNSDASLQLFQMAQGAGVRRFIFASTCSNYGRMATGDGWVSEETPLRPVSVYAETKVAVERELFARLGGNPMAVTVLRFATLYGLSPRMRFDLTVNEFIMELLVRGKLRVYGEQFWRPYLHVQDAARAILEVLRAEPTKVAGEVYNVGDSRENLRKIDLIEIIRRHVPVGEVEFVKCAEDPRDYRVSFAKIMNRLGFRIERRVSDGVIEIAEAIENGILSDFDSPRYRN